MFKLSRVILTLLVVGGGGWMILKNVSFEGLDQVKVKVGQDANGSQGFTPTGGAAAGDTIKIASFNIQVFGQSKLAKPEVMNVLADIVRRFDVVAIQEIRSKQQDVMPRFVELINSTGRRYDFAISRPLGRTVSTEQYAFVFDTDRIEIDRRSVYVVSDPSDLLHREPLVAGFRVRGPKPEEAFTFTLVDIHTDPDEVPEELDALYDVYQRVRDDGRGEDDIIVLGDLNTDDQHRGAFARAPYITWAITNTPTNVTRTKQYDNLLFHRDATTEFAGVAGALDFPTEYRLAPDKAKEVSDHLPVWAEFSVYEGGRPTSVATRPAQVR